MTGPNITIPMRLHFYCICFVRNWEVAYYIHMEGQFKNTHKWVHPRYVVNGTKFYIQLSMQEVLHNSMGQHKCIEHGNWDRFWYATTEEAMGSCTVPWTMNNSRICSDRTEMARVHSIYHSKEIVRMQNFVNCIALKAISTYIPCIP